VGQQHGVDALGRHVERLPVARRELPLLVQAAIDENLRTVNFEQMTRSGNILRGPKEPESCLHAVLLP
jgi:hypothetical protein